MNSTYISRFFPGCLTFVLACGLAAVATAQTRTLRIVTYNIEDDINGATTPLPGLIAPSGGSVTDGGVLEGIGEEILGSDPAQPLDILALQETTSNTTTVTPIVNGLNTYYNTPGMYAMSAYQATESGGDTADGNGPNALVYNTTTVQLLASVPVDPPGGTGQLGSSSGEYREVMRYEFAPAGVTPTAVNEFYIYVSHYKSGSTSSDQTSRTGEATIIRNDEANNLPAGAQVIYVGDYNISTSTETSYQIMLAATAPNGVAQGQGIDPMNPSGASGVDWTTSSLLNQKSESSTSLHYRDDFQVMTTNVYSGTPGGLALVSGTYHVFGNNGTTAYQGSVGSGNSALTNLVSSASYPYQYISASQLYTNLTTASDHLPVVADYAIAISAPSLTVAPASGLTSTGGAGGPFSPASQIYTLTNTGSGSLNWTAGNAASWLTVSPTSGALASGAGTIVTVSINANANSLAAGAYSDTVSFTNTSNGAGSATRSVSLTVTNMTPQLSVTPASGLTSSGLAGGPFSPASQTYSLTNVGGANLNWAAANTANWLTLSITGGTLVPGAGTNVTVSLNANANGLAAGSYSDTVSFTNTSNQTGSTTRSVSLTVTNAVPMLSVSPVSGLTSGGAVGGPFSPASQTYGLTNIGTAILNWTATNTSAWLTLSSTSGTLNSGAGTTVTVSINATASTLSAGSYSDTIAFVNLNNGAGNTTRSASLTASNFGFYDDFSTFASGNLVGQNNWVQAGTLSGTPLQVAGGSVIIPGGQTTDTQDAYKNFTQTNITLFYGLTLTVTSAVNNTSASYFAALWTSNNAAGFANYRLTAKAGDSHLTNCVLGIRVTGQSGDPYTFGTTILSTGVQYRVIVQAPSGYASASLYVNPTSADLASQTVYANNPVGTGTAPTSLGSFVISQYGTASIATDGISIGKVVVSDSFATVYNDLTPTPFQSWQTLYFGSTTNPAAAPAADPDNDGMSNWAEFLAGTNPTNAASSFRVLSVVRTNDDIRLDWTTVGGHSYVVQFLTNALSSPANFLDLSPVLSVPGTNEGATNYVHIGGATNPATFYRIRLAP